MLLQDILYYGEKLFLSTMFGIYRTGMSDENDICFFQISLLIKIYFCFHPVKSFLYIVILTATGEASTHVDNNASIISPVISL